MVKVLLASHGTFAKGIKNSLELILGKQPDVYILCAYIDGEDDVKSTVKNFIDSIKPDEEWIVATDIFGGSVNNEFMNYLNAGKKIHLISGMNLPLLIELVSNESEPVENRIREALKVSKDEVKYCNQLLAKTRAQSEEDF